MVRGIDDHSVGQRWPYLPQVERDRRVLDIGLAASGEVLHKTRYCCLAVTISSVELPGWVQRIQLNSTGEKVACKSIRWSIHGCRLHASWMKLTVFPALVMLDVLATATPDLHAGRVRCWTPCGSQKPAHSNGHFVQ